MTTRVREVRAVREETLILMENGAKKKKIKIV